VDLQHINDFKRFPMQVSRNQDLDVLRTQSTKSCCKNRSFSAEASVRNAAFH